MNRTLATVMTVGLLAALATACSDDTTGKLDTGPGKDQAPAADQSPAVDRGPGWDSGVNPDKAPPADQAPAADKAPPADKGPKPDKAPPKPDSAPKPDAWAASCGGVKCTLLNDCCTCRAYNPGTTVPVCPVTNCKQPTCGALAIKNPGTYCLKGQCIVGDRGTACSADSDCKRVDNCCDCIAIPKGASAPNCPIKSCFVPTCTGKGLSTAKARCVSGYCRLAF